MRKLLYLVATLGATYYFFDPTHGKRRRQTALDQASSSLGRGSQAASSVATNVSNQTHGFVRETVKHIPDNPAPDDNTLRDRVESELFRDPTIPKGNLNIFVIDGVVDLRGELASQQLIDTVIERAQAVEHVKGVRSYLHLPHTVAPNKEEAIEAGEGAV
ncbi:MAG: hypothetical protein NVS2B16_04920 [Chloroflexota bacterium]